MYFFWAQESAIKTKILLLGWLYFTGYLYSQQNINISLPNYKIGNSQVTYEVLSPEKLRVKVLNESNQPVENLTKADFSIKIGENSTDIVDVVPLSEFSNANYRIVLCLDNSSSMSSYKNDLLNILETLINGISKSAEVAVVFFDDKDSLKNFSYGNEPLKIQMKKFSGDNNKLDSFCKKYYDDSYLTAKTYLLDQMYVAFNNVVQTDNQEIFYVMFSDGEDNASETDFDVVLNSYKKGKVYSIDFSNYSYRKNILKDLCEKSGGEYYRAEDASELSGYFKQIANKIIFSGYEVTFKEYFPPEISDAGIYFLENNSYKSTGMIKFEEIKSKELYPLLNYVFFDFNSSDICSRYSSIDKTTCTSFDEARLPADQLSVYHNLLNVIGKRLTVNEKIKIKIYGCNNNDGDEKNNLTLSKMRAEKVKQYLTDVWGIAPERISINAQNLPQKPSNNIHINGKEENRRVEIISDDPSLFDPVEIETDTKISEPGNLQVYLKTRYSSDPDSWELVVNQKENLLYNTEGKSYPPSYVSWNVNESLKNKSIDNSPLDIYIKLKDKNGLETKNLISQLPVIYLSSQQKNIEKLGDRSIEKLSLFLFDFNSSALSKRNEDILLKAKNAIAENSKLSMFGYTDSMGTETVNSKLSQQRSQNALKQLVKILKPVTKDLISDGYGESVPLYDNGTPEGRFYNRTCQLVIETPVKPD